MKKLLSVVLMVIVLSTQTTFGAGLYGDYSLYDTRPDGEFGYQWYEESWSQLELKKIIVDKSGTCTGITLYDRLKGLTITFDFKITKDRLSKYKLQGNKFFYNYQADWFQVETKKGDIIYTDVPADPLNGELYNIEISKLREEFIMLNAKLKKNWEENKGTYLTVGVLVGAGFFLGCRYQKKVDVRNLTKSLEAGKAMIPNLVGTEKIFPMSMSIPEIKETAKGFKNTAVGDAVVVAIDGLPMLFVR